MSRDIYTDPRPGDRVQFRSYGDEKPRNPVVVTKVDERGVSFVRPSEGSFGFAGWEIWQCRKYKMQELLSGPQEVIEGGRHD
ncbi:hypothetical protein CEK60_05990 [Halomonas sp. N3-2A]|nr:hypothetical protein CEK60_05990 [Halomonas sp. N3-2A]